MGVSDLSTAKRAEDSRVDRPVVAEFIPGVDGLPWTKFHLEKWGVPARKMGVPLLMLDGLFRGKIPI